MPSIQGIKLLSGPPVNFTVPDGSPHAGESAVWRDRQSSGTVELWFLGATWVFTRTGGANGIYTLQPGSSSNALEVWDLNSNWADGTGFGLSAMADPFPRGLPPTDAYNYAFRLTDSGQGLTWSDFLCASGALDVSSCSVRFLSQPSPSHIFTAKLYYQHQ